MGIWDLLSPLKLFRTAQKKIISRPVEGVFPWNIQQRSSRYDWGCLVLAIFVSKQMLRLDELNINVSRWKHWECDLFLMPNLSTTIGAFRFVIGLPPSHPPWKNEGASQYPHFLNLMLQCHPTCDMPLRATRVSIRWNHGQQHEPSKIVSKHKPLWTKYYFWWFHWKVVYYGYISYSWSTHINSTNTSSDLISIIFTTEFTLRERKGVSLNVSL